MSDTPTPGCQSAHQAIAILPLVPAPVFPEEGLVGVETDDGVGAGGADDVLAIQVGAAKASGRTDKRESAAASIAEGETEGS